jgi:hypothetical protein
MNNFPTRWRTTVRVLKGAKTPSYQNAVPPTPAQMLRDLPSALSFPAPIMLQAEAPQIISAAGPIANQTLHATRKPALIGSTGTTALPSNPGAKSGQAVDAILPAADLKPLYDFALDGKACQTKLAAAQSDLTDEKTKPPHSPKSATQPSAPPRGKCPAPNRPSRKMVRTGRRQSRCRQGYPLMLS